MKKDKIMFVVSEELANKELDAFLEENDIDLNDLNSEKEGRGNEGDKVRAKLVKGIQKGNIIIEEGVITVKLKLPLKDSNTGEVKLDQLKYNNRVTLAQRNRILGLVKKGDQASALMANVVITSTVTGVPQAMVEKLDQVDAKTVEAVSGLFFM